MRCAMMRHIAAGFLTGATITAAACVLLAAWDRRR